METIDLTHQPDIDYDRVNAFARDYAKGLQAPVQINFVKEGEGVAWVVDDVGSGTSLDQKTVFINLPLLQHIVYTQTEKLGRPQYPTLDQIIQIALHEVGHLHENAELEYRGPQVKQSDDYGHIWHHTLPPFVANIFDALPGDTLLAKRQQLIRACDVTAGGVPPSYHVFENMIRDVRVNDRSVDLRHGIRALRSAMQKNYIDWAFPGNDWTLPNEKGKIMPLHMQFGQGLLRNAMTPNDPVNLDSRVQKLLGRYADPHFAIRNGNPISIIGMASDVSVPFCVRLPYLFFLYEQYKLLFQQDTQQQEKEQQKNKKSTRGKKTRGAGKPTQNTGGKDGNSGDQTPDGGGNETGGNPFQSWEDAAAGQPHPIEDALGEETTGEIIKKLAEGIKAQAKEDAKSPSRKDAETRLKNTRYRDLERTNPSERNKKVDLLEKRYTILLPDICSTYADVLSMIEQEIFEKIKSRRSWEIPENKGPVDMDRGNGQLHPDGMIQLVKDIIAGHDPTKTEARQRETTQERNEQLVTELTFRLILDGSGSMQDDDTKKLYKNRDQTLNALLCMQAIKNITERLQNDIQVDPAKSLSIWTEGMIYTGAGSGKNIIRKPLSNDWTDEDIVQALENLSIASGTTPLHLALEHCLASNNNRNEQQKQRILQKKEVDIVLVLSDGQTDDGTKDKKLIASLREQGTITSGIGITKDGSPMKKLFGTADAGQGSGAVCERPEDLGIHMQAVLVGALERCV